MIPRPTARFPDLGGKVLRDLDNEEKELHKWLLNQRNTLIAHSDTEAVDLKFVVYDFGDRKMLQPIRNEKYKALRFKTCLPFKALASKMLNYVAAERDKLEPEMIELLTDDDIEEIANN